MFLWSNPGKRKRNIIFTKCIIPKRNVYVYAYRIPAGGVARILEWVGDGVGGKTENF